MSYIGDLVDVGTRINASNRAGPLLIRLRNGRASRQEAEKVISELHTLCDGAAPLAQEVIRGMVKEIEEELARQGL